MNSAMALHPLVIADLPATLFAELARKQERSRVALLEMTDAAAASIEKKFAVQRERRSAALPPWAGSPMRRISRRRSRRTLRTWDAS